MAEFMRRGSVVQVGLLCLLAALLLFTDAVHHSTSNAAPQPLVLSARMEKGTLTYRLDGRRVEDSVQNSLLTNLGRIVRSRGSNLPVWIIIDVRAPFGEVGKLETALDMSDLTDRRVFVTDFTSRVMNEVRWDERAIPLPRVY